MNEQTILRICQCCYRHIEDHTKKWDKKSPATHGICAVCVKGIEEHGNDKFIDMTEGDRK